MTDITLKIAEEVIRLRNELTHCNGILANLGKELRSVKVEIEYETGFTGYSQKTFDIVSHKAQCHDSRLARSIAAGVRQYWERRRDECIRNLRQIGAEVPS